MEKNLTTGSVFGNIVRFSLPYLFSYFLQTLYGMADLFIIGQYADASGTTAVSVGSQVMHMLTLMIVGLAMGATVTIGQAVGARDQKSAARYTGNTMTLFLVLSVAVTGLLLALPRAERDTTLYVRRAVSTPYLDMTLATAARFGVEISQRDYEEFYIPGGQRYEPADFAIEGDWSAAAMLLVMGATAGEITVRNVSMLSKQADTAVCTALARAGAAVIHEGQAVTAAHRPLHAFEFDATHCPDLFPALAALAAAAEGVSTIRGTSRLEYKECNRAEAIRDEYAKLGIEVDTSEEDVMRIRGGAIRSARVRSYGDHRMAMSLAVAALRSDGEVEIEGAESVAKSYPDFFGDLERVRI